MAFSSFLFNDPATPDTYTLSLHDALPICGREGLCEVPPGLLDALAVHAQQQVVLVGVAKGVHPRRDRKSTRLNSSHSQISYAVFCLKKKIHRDLALDAGALTLALHLHALL